MLTSGTGFKNMEDLPSVTVDPAATTQWQLRRGTHEIRAVGASGRVHEVTIDVH